MGGNKKILIWIGILALIGIILLMVACETGVLLPQNEQQGEITETQDQQTETIQPQITPQLTENAISKPEEAPKTITIGKPYSGKLVEEGNRNILIVGEDKLNNLYDTIGIASINSTNKTVKLIMIPRDTYIEYNSDIISKLEEINLAHSPGIYKINYAHHIGDKIEYNGRFDSAKLSFLADVVQEKFNIHLSDYIKINTKGFKELVDHLGGIDMYVPYNMDYEDPTQDLYIHISKGMHHLGGSDAEGFVRFRQGTKEDGTYFEIGDTGRKKNQINFLQQLIKQKGTIANIGKIPGLIDLLGKNVQHSIGFGDILQTYMGIAKNVILEDYEITSENLNSENMIRIDGSSYLQLE